MPSVTATQVISDALGDLNILQDGETVAANTTSTQQTDLLRRLNLLVGQWANEALTIPAQSRFVFPLQANKGSSTNPYTVGAGGDLSTDSLGQALIRPTYQQSLVGVGLLLNASSPPVEIPRGIMTNEAFQLNRVKNLTSTLFTSAHYRPDYAGDLGSLFLWPVPTDLTNSLVLYIEQAISTFANLTTSYSVPPGYDEALHLNFALKIARPYGRTITPDLRQDAREALAAIKRANTKMIDLPNDLAGIGQGLWGHRQRFNIQSGEPY